MSTPALSVLFVTPDLEVGWPNGQLLDLALGLKRRRVPVRVIAASGRLAHELARRGIDVTLAPLPKRPLVALPLGLDRHAELVRDARVIHAWGSGAAAAGETLARAARVPLVLTLHDRADAQDAPRVARARVGAIFVPSLASQEELVNRRGVPRELVRVAPPGIDLERLGVSRARAPDRERPRDSDQLPVVDPTPATPVEPRPSPPPPPRELLAPGRAPVVGTLGRLEPLGGHATLLEATRLLVQRNVDLRVVIAGEGPERGRLFALARQAKVTDQVVFAGDLPGRGEAFEALDIFVAPAEREGFAHDLLEAMARGRPVVATGQGAIFDLVEDGKTGLLVAPRDATALADAIERLLREPSFARNLGVRAREAAVARWPSDPLVDETLDAYERAVAPVGA